MSVYPELVTGRTDGAESGRWRVRPGTSLRGGASCDLLGRVIEVPLGPDAASRVVRAHELMHLRISPVATDFLGSLFDVSTRALECVEEFRVNALLGRLGFNVALLCDGTEKPGALQLAREGRWDEAVCFLFAVLGTGAEKPFLAGLRRERPEWMPGLRALRRRALVHVERLDNRALASTQLDASGAPEGYARVTIVLARLASQVMHAPAPQGEDALRAFRRSLAPGARRLPTGHFAPLVLSEAALGLRRRSGAERYRRPSTTGTCLVWPGRLLTDDRRAGFARARRGSGGVVLVDQSGSMGVEPEELSRWLARWPQCVVVGYSHRPGDQGGTPNAWVLVSPGRVKVASAPGNVGNGVDGPALEWALSLRRRGEVMVMVTDGQVTDSHDHPSAELAARVAQLVAAHQVRLVRRLEEVPAALAATRWRNEWGAFGRLGRAFLIRR